MVTEQSKINNLEQEILYLRQEISRLRMILDCHGINYIQQSPKNNCIKNVSTQDITREHALLLYSVFKGRKDVYSKRCNLKNGGSAYYTQCDNFWQPGICPKASGAKIKCFECSNRKWTPLRQRVLIDHLNGKKMMVQTLSVFILSFQMTLAIFLYLILTTMTTTLHR